LIPRLPMQSAAPSAGRSPLPSSKLFLLPPPGIEPLLKTKAQPHFDRPVTGRSNLSFAPFPAPNPSLFSRVCVELSLLIRYPLNLSKNCACIPEDAVPLYRILFALSTNSREPCMMVSAPSSSHLGKPSMSSSNDTLEHLKKSLDSLNEALKSAHTQAEIAPDEVELIQTAIKSAQRIHDKLIKKYFGDPFHQGSNRSFSVSRAMRPKKQAR
jgi:hypothetical protein